MVGKVNRNDLCPCGSGKKYKNCCGVHEAVSITSLLEREVEQLQSQIIAHADFLYGETMDVDFSARVAPSLIDDENEMEFFSFIHTIWYTLFHPLPSGQTILEEFIDQQSKFITRPSLRQVLMSWTAPRPIAGRLLSLDAHHVVVRDVLTEESFKIKLLSPVTATEQSMIFGFIVPFREDLIFFPTFFDMEAEPDLKDERLIKESFLKSGYDNPQDFLTDEIIDLMNEMQYLTIDINTGHFDWPLPVHKKVADQVVEDLKKVEAPDELIGTALLLWNRFVQVKPKQIKNAPLYSAAIQYVAMNIHPLVQFDPNEFALEMGVSGSSLKRTVKDLEQTLQAELNELQEAILQDFDDLDGEIPEWYDWEEADVEEDDDDDDDDDELPY